jgi:plastocyanin
MLEEGMKKTSALSVAMAALVVALLGASSISAESYEEVSVPDGGAVSGRVVYKGTVPMRNVVPTKNQDVCGGPRKDPLIVVGKDGGVEQAVAVLEGVKKGKAWEKPAAPPEIDNKGCRFVPHVQVVPLGTKFDIVNTDPVLHNTHGFYGNKTAFNVALPFPGARVGRVLDRAGVIRVDCDVHGWMRGWVYVAENPYYAMTGEDGSFSIKDVPPGDYTLEIWQEQTGTTEKRVSVKAGQTTDIGTIELKE